MKIKKIITINFEPIGEKVQDKDIVSIIVEYYDLQCNKIEKIGYNIEHAQESKDEIIERVEQHIIRNTSVSKTHENQKFVKFIHKKFIYDTNQILLKIIHKNSRCDVINDFKRDSENRIIEELTYDPNNKKEISKKKYIYNNEGLCVKREFSHFELHNYTTNHLHQFEHYLNGEIRFDNAYLENKQIMTASKYEKYTDKLINTEVEFNVKQELSSIEYKYFKPTGQILREIIIEDSIPQLKIYTYNKHNNITSEKCINLHSDNTIYHYLYCYQYDTYGNWIEKKFYDQESLPNELSRFTTRQIEYL